MTRFKNREVISGADDFSREVKEQIRKNRIKPRRLFKKMKFLRTKTVYLGKLFLENEKIKVEGFTPHYMESLKNVLHTKCEDEELMQNEPDLSICCYVEKKIAKCKIKSCKSPEDNYGISASYHIIDDRLFNNFFIRSQMAVFDHNKILYGEIISPYETDDGEPSVNIVLCHSSKLESKEEKIYGGLETVYYFEDVPKLNNITNSMKSFFKQNTQPRNLF